jgi:ribosomal protein S18 acetylase RimI-like enzyme
MEIRTPRPSDRAEDISRVYALSWKTAYRGILTDHYLNTLPLDHWVPMLQENLFCSLILSDGHQIIGTAGFGRSRDASMSDWGEIISLYLLPGYLRRGFGSSLLQAAETELAAKGFRSIFLWVLSDNLPALRFYEIKGYTPTAEHISVFIDGRELKEIRCIKYLE